ncbi:hypothetical protein BC941DRAFT_458060 [Chlamydoabsidia padenii]|nr:hypothetical protein BC941DRAFT_458060 [Chlamydoabsidia padenii]
MATSVQKLETETCLAAEIGQSLLRKNEDCTAESKQLKKKVQYYQERMHELETSLADSENLARQLNWEKEKWKRLCERMEKLEEIKGELAQSKKNENDLTRERKCLNMAYDTLSVAYKGLFAEYSMQKTNYRQIKISTNSQSTMLSQMSNTILQNIMAEVDTMEGRFFWLAPDDDSNDDDGDDDDDKGPDVSSLSVDSLASLVQLLQELLQEIVQSTITINQLQLAYVKKVEKDDARLTVSPSNQCTMYLSGHNSISAIGTTNNKGTDNNNSTLANSISYT